MTLCEILERHLRRSFEGKTVNIPQGSHNVGAKIDSLNKKISSLSCEIDGKDFDATNCKLIPNPFSQNKPMLQSMASAKTPLVWKRLDGALELEVTF